MQTDRTYALGWSTAVDLPRRFLVDNNFNLNMAKFQVQSSSEQSNAVAEEHQQEWKKGKGVRWRCRSGDDPPRWAASAGSTTYSTDETLLHMLSLKPSQKPQCTCTVGFQHQVGRARLC